MAKKHGPRGTMYFLVKESTGEVIKGFSAIRQAVAYVGTLRDAYGHPPKTVGAFLWELAGERVKLKQGITYEQLRLL